MTTYTETDMVDSKHVLVIEEQLKKLGSKAKDKLEEERDCSLANILYLACGGGSYGLSLDDINSIGNQEFKINCSCKNSITRQRKD